MKPSDYFLIAVALGIATVILIPFECTVDFANIETNRWVMVFYVYAASFMLWGPLLAFGFVVAGVLRYILDHIEIKKKTDKPLGEVNQSEK